MGWLLSSHRTGLQSHLWLAWSGVQFRAHGDFGSFLPLAGCQTEGLVSHLLGLLAGFVLFLLQAPPWGHLTEQSSLLPAGERGEGLTHSTTGTKILGT
jgi:hypothetical protein